MVTIWAKGEGNSQYSWGSDPPPYSAESWPWNCVPGCTNVSMCVSVCVHAYICEDMQMHVRVHM